jgi:hypothetical protein
MHTGLVIRTLGVRWSLRLISSISLALPLCVRWHLGNTVYSGLDGPLHCSSVAWSSWSVTLVLIVIVSNHSEAHKRDRKCVHNAAVLKCTSTTTLVHGIHAQPAAVRA